MNLSKYLNRFYQDLGEPNTNRFPISLMKDWLYEAEKHINREAPFIKKELIENSVANQRLYDFPSNILDFQISSIEYPLNGNILEREKLFFTNIEQLRKTNSTFQSETGNTPYECYIDFTEKKYGLYPTPLQDGTNYIRVLYNSYPTKMTRYYTTGTISVTNGSAVVTGSGTAFTGNVSVGDEIGIGKLLNRSTDFPSVFYTVLTVDSDTQLTLTTNYAGATASAQSYISCSPSLIIYDGLNDAVLTYIMALAKRKDKDMNEFRALRAEALAMARYEFNQLIYTADCNNPMIPEQSRYVTKLGEDYGWK